MPTVDSERGSVQVATRVSPATAIDLERLAAMNDRTIAAELRIAIAKHLVDDLYDRERSK